MKPLTYGKMKYAFTAAIWQHSGTGGWHFVSVPKAISDEIRANLQSEEEGWGRMKAVAQIGQSEWTTAIWFDTKHQLYLLPIKAEIRKKEKITSSQDLQVWLWV